MSVAVLTRQRPRAALSVWLYDAALALAGAAWFVLVVARLPQHEEQARVPLLAMIAFFCAAESFRVYVHFRRNAQSFSLSELPLVVGLFMLTPNQLVLARLAGAAIGLGLIRRHSPIKLIYNLAAFVVEAELVVTLYRLLPSHDISSPAVWFGVLLVSCAGSLSSFVMSAVAITLAEGGPSRRRWSQPAAIVLVGGLANASLALALVSTIARSAVELFLLVTPLGALAAAYALYTREHHKRTQLQHLYQSSDLLQRASADRSAIPELLAQLCEVFRAEVATVTLLPVASGTESLTRITLRRGECVERQETVSTEMLEHFTPILDEHQRAMLAVRGDSEPRRHTWCTREALRDAMAVVLQSDGTLLGSMVVGNRLSDVSTFDADDLALFEAFAAQTSVAVQNTRLGHRLKQQAFADPITNLANRALFMDRLEHALTRREHRGELLAVIFLDLDDFKTVNDSLGHAAGDELLCAVGDRLN